MASVVVTVEGKEDDYDDDDEEEEDEEEDEDEEKDRALSIAAAALGALVRKIALSMTANHQRHLDQKPQSETTVPVLYSGGTL